VPGRGQIPHRRRRGTDELRALLEAREILLRRRLEGAIDDVTRARERLGSQQADGAELAISTVTRCGEAALRAAGETGEIAGAFRGIGLELANNFLDAAPKVGENAWRMPIPASYERHIDTPIADVKNTGNGRAGGSITAALFLQRFTNGVPWAHIDIAPTAWVKDSRNPTVPDGAVGWGVRSLDRMVQDFYEV
jgi:hypothetical protein